MKIIRIFARKSNCNKHENKSLCLRKDLANREKQFEQTEGCRSFPVHSGNPYPITIRVITTNKQNDNIYKYEDKK